MEMVSLRNADQRLTVYPTPNVPAVLQLNLDAHVQMAVGTNVERDRYHCTDFGARVRWPFAGQDLQGEAFAVHPLSITRSVVERNTFDSPGIREIARVSGKYARSRNVGGPCKYSVILCLR